MINWIRRARVHRRPAPLYFLHIPKTAGSSMRRLLTEKFGDRLCPAVMWDDFFRAPELRSARYDAYAGHFGIELPRFLDTPMRAFTILRDPIARTVSHYSHVHRDVTHPMHDLVSKQTLRDFVFDPATVPMVLNFQARYLTSTGMGSEQLASIFTPYWGNRYTLSVAWESASCYADVSILEKSSLSALHSLEFVGLTERFDDDLLQLHRSFGLPNIRFPRSNVSPKDEATQFIGPEVEARIRYLTSVDAALYSAAQALRMRAKSSP